jgi:hypothetical protein
VPELLPSQGFGFYLARRASEAGKLIIFVRSQRLRTEAVPELAGYERSNFAVLEAAT